MISVKYRSPITMVTNPVLGLLERAAAIRGDITMLDDASIGLVSDEGDTLVVLVEGSQELHNRLASLYEVIPQE